MVQRGWGRVQFVFSESAIQIPTEMVHYGMPKTALLAVSRGTAESVPATGITINCLLRSCQGSLDDDDLATLEDVKQAKNPMQAIAEQS